MFKAFGTFLHRIPWWGLILGGIVTLILLAMFATPVQVIRLAESGDSPEMKRAIQREIDSAFGDSALGLAEGVVKALQKNTNDPVRRAELDRAQEEIARAREEILSAQSSAKESAKDVAREAAATAVAAVRTATEATYEAAVERRVAIEEARAEVQNALKSAGIGGEEALRTVDEQLRAAKDQEDAAHTALKTLQDPPKPANGNGKKPKGMVFGPQGLEINLGSDKKVPRAPSPPSPPAAPAASSAPDAPPAVVADAGGTVISLDLDAPDPSLPPLPPELRREIHERVATDVRRIGVGGALIAAFIPLFFMTMVAKYFIGRSRRAQAFAEVKQKEAETQSAGRQIMEARLQALQAQVEPHFLYNTLANVQALTEVDPPAANKMVGHLIEYLRAALPKMRETSSTIGQEVELARAYLNILKMRMGPRLDFAINVPTELNAMPFPPLMLPSLVENAIKHGLEPVREGGRVDVTVELIGDRLRVSVRDTGRGLNGDADGGLARAANKGGGVGLSNIRERMLALYGDAGRFTLEGNQPSDTNTSGRGVTATIELPANGAAQFTPSSSNAPLGIGSFTTTQPEPPKTWWRRTARIAGATHSAWAKAMSFTLIGIMIVLAILFGLALAGMVTGWLPVQWGGSEMTGVNGLAVGTIVLLFVFGILAIVAMLVVALIYGVGIFAVGVVIFALLVALISAFPALAPFVLVGLFFYWIFFRRKKKVAK
jgi:Histidine kinase/Histidine kinase-, DNA gyrase B-, and HSP90-like ATPase